MRSKTLVAAVAVAVALVAVPAALAGMMHPELGAKLSGMGDHGIVNFQSHEKKGELCWTFDLHVMHVTTASIRDEAGMVVARLGHMYTKKGCAMVAKKALTMLEEKPGSYRVWVDTKGHPGELRGKLFAGMAHM
jgi:hypothetical protein